MSEKEQNDYPKLAYFYKIALATGVSKERAKLFASDQLRKKYDLSYLRIIE